MPGFQLAEPMGYVDFFGKKASVPSFGDGRTAERIVADIKACFS
jgi:hypothetical protein